MQIRRTNPDDAAMLATLAVKTFCDTFAGTCTDEDLEAYIRGALTHEKLRSELARDANLFFLAFEEGHEPPIGYLKLRTGITEACIQSANAIELERLYVDQLALGKGIGAALLRTALDTGRAMGHSSVWLGVWEHNHRAKAFYQRWGFTVVGDHVFRVGSDDQTDLIMQRSLSNDDIAVAT